MILFSQWLSLPLEVRHKISGEFGIIKKNPTHVVNNEVVSDGYTVKDIEEALTVEKLQLYLASSDTNISNLFDMLVERIKNQMKPISINVPAGIPDREITIISDGKAEIYTKKEVVIKKQIKAKNEKTTKRK